MAPMATLTPKTTSAGGTIPKTATSRGAANQTSRRAANQTAGRAVTPKAPLPEQWEMTDFEIGRAYRLAKDPEMMIDILADLNAVSRRKMRRKMVSLGLIPAKRQGATRGSHWSPAEDKLLEQAMESGCSFAAAGC